MPNLFLEQRCVDDIELNKRVRAKLVVETADRRKYSFLSILANRMVTDAIEIAAGAATIELTVASAPSVISMVLKSKTCPNRLPK